MPTDPNPKNVNETLAYLRKRLALAKTRELASELAFLIDHYIQRSKPQSNTEEDTDAHHPQNTESS